MFRFGAIKSQLLPGPSVLVSLSLHLLLLLEASTLSSANSLLLPHCGVCEVSKCPALNYCEGKAIKDHCQCCMVCSDNTFQPHISISTHQNNGDACDQVKCPNLKVCVENVQGLPLCECPGEHMCRRSKKREICGTDGITYTSRCLMRIASCNHGVHIRKMYRGSCKPDDAPADAAAYRKKLKKLKRRMRKRRQRKRGLSRSGKRKSDDRKKEKRRRKRRKTDNRNKNRRRSRKNRNKKIILRKQKKTNFDKLAWENNFGLATWN